MDRSELCSIRMVPVNPVAARLTLVRAMAVSAVWVVLTAREDEGLMI